MTGTGLAPVVGPVQARAGGELVRAATLSSWQAQAAFRAVLDALSRPGRVARLPEGPLGTVPAALLPLLALADLGTGICVLDDDQRGDDQRGDDQRGDDQRWTDVVRVATNAPAVPLERARLVAAVRTIASDDVLRLCRGSAEAPEDGALLSVAVSDVDGGPRNWRLSGPGVPGERVIAPMGLPAAFVAARAAAVSDFPAGVDLLLVAPGGHMLGLPRTTIIQEED